MASVKEVVKVVYSGLQDKTSGARLREILKVLHKNEVHKGVTPAGLVRLLEDLGPTFIKLGQILSSRSDVLPTAYCKELECLRSNTTPEPFSVIEDRLRRVYGEEFDEIFESIDEEPLGSASIAQVHRAKLRKEQTYVALKIQRHHVKEDMLRDISLLRRAVDLADLSPAPMLNSVDLTAVLDEFEDTVRDEIDFNAECSNLLTIKENNKNREGVACPHVYPEYSNERVLVMEFIEGFSLEEVDALDASRYNAHDIGSRMAGNYMRQMVEDGFFHADPHPANVVVRPSAEFREAEAAVVAAEHTVKHAEEIAATFAQDDTSQEANTARIDVEIARLALEDAQADLKHAEEGDMGEIVWIDCGMIGQLTTIERRQFFDMMSAMIKRDGHTLTNLFLEWGRPVETKSKLNYGMLLQDLTNLVNRYCVTDAVDIDIASMMTDILETLETAHIVMPRSFVTLVRGLAALQGTLLAICPEISIWNVTRDYMESYTRRSFDPVKKMEEQFARAQNAFDRAGEIPIHMANVLDMVEKGRLRVAMDLTEASEPMDKLGKIMDRLSLACITAGLFIGSSFIYAAGMQPHFFGIPIVGFFGYMGAAILSIYIVRQISKGR